MYENNYNGESGNNNQNTDSNNYGYGSNSYSNYNYNSSSNGSYGSYSSGNANGTYNSTWNNGSMNNGSMNNGSMNNGSTGARREKKSGGRVQKFLLTVSLGLLFGIFAGIGFYGVRLGMETSGQTAAGATTETTAESGEVTDETTDSAAALQQTTGTQIVYADGTTSVSEIVEQVMPAMVSIVNSYTETYDGYWGQTYSQDAESSGSGIIVAKTDEELLIVTNQHVVADANALTVTLCDGTEVSAKTKGTDSDMDLAVIAIDLEDMTEDSLNAITIATLGDSDTLSMGDQVIAIGNALGYGQSATVGYVSALDREITLDDGSTRTYIQTDAAINPGNSGGALLNMAGEVIGINSAKIGGTSIEGMGYAIPITSANPIIAELMERQTRDKVDEDEMGYIGINYQNVTSQLSQYYGMPEGVYVTNVYEGSGAEAAGIMKGDIITDFDGNSVSSYSDLSKVMQYYKVGDTVSITVQRPQNGEYTEVTLTLTLGEKPVTDSQTDSGSSNNNNNNGNTYLFP